MFGYAGDRVIRGLGYPIVQSDERCGYAESYGVANSPRNERNFAAVVLVGFRSKLAKPGSLSMLSIHSTIPRVRELKAFSSFFWARRRRDGISYDVLRRRSFGWGWVNYERQHSLTISAYNIRATGSTGESAESSSNFPLQWDPFEDLFGFGVDLRSRKDNSKQQPKQKYELEMPCPTCEGRGYLFCPHCKFRKSEASCPHCSGRGYDDCPRCHGECVVWEEDSLNESKWASFHSRSPLQTAEDDAIENMASTSTPKRRTRRVYGPPPPETREKIRRALKELEARTGSISTRMKNIHQDPILHAKRTAAIKKARGTDEARKLTSERLKEYFKSPENRIKHSQSMTGVRFTCKACGEVGHRRHFCPKLGFTSKKTVASRPYRCSSCGQVGHGRRRCSEKKKLDSSPLLTITHSDENHHPTLKTSKRCCRICGQAGHNSRTCSVPAVNNENKS